MIFSLLEEFGVREHESKLLGTPWPILDYTGQYLNVKSNLDFITNEYIKLLLYSAIHSYLSLVLMLSTLMYQTMLKKCFKLICIKLYIEL